MPCKPLRRAARLRPEWIEIDNDLARCRTADDGAHRRFLHHFESRLDALVEKAGELCEAEPIVPGVAVVRHPERCVQVQLVSGPRHRDVQEAPLLVEPFASRKCHVDRHGTVYQVREVNDLPLEPLSRVDRRGDYVVLVQVWLVSEIPGGRRWIHGELGQPDGEVVHDRCCVHESFQVLQSCRRTSYLLSTSGLSTSRTALARPPGDGSLRASRRPPRDADNSVRAEAGAAATISGQRDSASVSDGRANSTRILAACRPQVTVETKDAVPGNLIVGVAQEPASGDEVLDVSSFEEAKAAVLPVRHLSHRKLYLDEIAVVRGACEDRLLAKLNSAFVGSEDPIDDGSCLD